MQSKQRLAPLTNAVTMKSMEKIASSAPMVIFEFQIWPDGRKQVHFISDQCEQVFGVKAQQIYADANLIVDALSPQDAKQPEILSRPTDGAPATWQYEFSRSAVDGSPCWYLATVRCEFQLDSSTRWCGCIVDFSTQKQLLLCLQDSEKRFRTLTQLSADWFWEQDENFRFVRIYGHFDNNISPQSSNLIGKTRWELDVLGISEEVWAAHKKQLHNHEVFHDFEMQCLRPDGSVMWLSTSGLPIFNKQGVFIGYCGVGRDISERKRVEVEIERLAFYDALTGLPNRRMLIDRLRQALDFSARRATFGALLFIDLDNFKTLNDTLGHQMGDELLKQVAQRLGKCVRSVDTVARLGGDEFIVMLEEIGEEAHRAAALAETIGYKIVHALNQEYNLGGQAHHSSPSIGVTLFFQHECSIDELLKRADLAMYQAKAAGRNTLRFFEPDMQAAASARAAMEKDLRQALARNEFVFHYQPIVDTSSQIMGVEALLRWMNPQRGMIMAADFVPIAEQTGVFLELSQWVLEVACAQLVAWSKRPATQHLTLSVNISARQFRHKDFSVQILNVLRESGANPKRLKLELTESLLLGDIQDAAIKMEGLRSIGVGFLLDDFGTGYSSLSHLKRLPLDYLKIDKSFICDILENPNDAAITRTILNLAQSLNIGVVAEGVETMAQYNFLVENGCKAFQGYLFGHPTTLDRLRL